MLMKIKMAENIKSFRKERGLTQEQLAEALGVTVGAVYKWEAGLSTPEIRLIMELADLFEVSVDVLLGYEQKSGNVEAVLERMAKYYAERNFEEAVAEAEKALKKYPNYFQLVYQTALVYQVKFFVDREEKNIERSNVLLNHAISLLYQNSDEDISEITIRNKIAENYLISEKTEQAIQILKKNNVCGINNSLIGLTYANKLNRPKEARPYLLQDFCACASNLLRTTIGFIHVYEKEKNHEKQMDTLLWLCDFADSLKLQKDRLEFTDKIKAVIWINCAIAEAGVGKYESAQQYTKHAYVLAKQFDAKPEYGVHGIRFCEQADMSVIAIDDMGDTAMIAIENNLYDEHKTDEAHRFVQKMWEELKNEANNG